MDRFLQTIDIPTVVRTAAIFVGLVQVQIPAGIERIDFEFKVRMIVAIWVDKQFEVIVLKDHRIVFFQGGPHMRLFQVGGQCKNTDRPTTS